MKKKRMKRLFMQNCKWRKIFRVMRLSLILFFCGLQLASAKVEAQAKITVEQKQITYLDLFNQIKEQTGFTVVYSNNELDKKKLVEAGFIGANLKDVLDKILEGTGLCYELMDEFVILKVAPKEEKKMLKITGIVTDKDKYPLPGVTVILKGTAVGTATDTDGRYQLQIPKAEHISLLFSFVGMKTQEVKYTGKDSINVVMEEDYQEMDEVVVTGYQVIDKRQLTSSVSSIDASELEKVGALTVDKMLEGKAAGLMVTTLSSTPGAASKIRVRTGGTFTGSREPLWVIDGVIYEDPVPLTADQINSFDQVNLIGNALTGINPQDIASINILKDASATAIYGTRAANGVIVITTKRGKKGNVSLSYSGNIGVVDRPRYRNFNVMDSKERIDVSREIRKKNLSYPSNIFTFVGYEGALREYMSGNTNFSEFQNEVSRLETMNTDWFGELYQPAITTSHSLSLSGGTDNVRYYFSVGYNNEKGAEKGVEVNRLTARSNVDFNLRKNILISLNMSGSVQEARYNHSSVNVFNQAYYTSRAVPFKNADGSLFYIDKQLSGLGAVVLSGKYNIQNEMNNSERNVDNKDFNLAATLNWDLAKGIKLMGNISYRSTTNLTEEWITENTFYVADLRKYDGVEDKIDEIVNRYSLAPFGGLYSGGMTSQQSYSGRLQLNMSKVLWDKHVFNLNLGYEVNSVKYEGSDGWMSPGYNHSQGRSFIELPRFSVPSTGIIEGYGYNNMLSWLSTSGSMDIYPTITDQLKNSLSWFGIFTYSYDNRYILNFNMRSDGSNAFGQYERYKFRPTWSVSARWNIQNEKFMPKGKVEELALRLSYGFRGTVPSALPYMVIQNYQYDPTFQENLAQLASFPNANLTWERTSTLNVGLNHAWFEGRLSGAFDFAYSKGEDLLLSRPVSLVNGQGSQLYNGGSKEDYSYEMSLRGIIVKGKDFGWSMNGNVTHSKEKVLKGQEVETLQVNSYLDGSIYQTGFPVDAFYSYQFDGLNEKGLPQYKNLEKDPGSVTQYFNNVLTYSGRRTPQVYGGFGTEFRYKNLTLSANFSYKFGQKVRLLRLYNGSQNMPMPHENMSAEFNDRWRQPGDEAHCVIPGLSSEALTVSESSGATVAYLVPYKEIVPSGSANGWYMYDMSDERVVKGDHIRWQSLTLGYTFPQNIVKAIGASYLRLNFQVSNLGVWAFDEKLKGQDPEQVQGIGMPTLPTYNFSLNVSF